MTTRRQSESPTWLRGWASDSALLLTSQALTVIATSAAAILIARALDPDDWAVFSAFLGLSLALALVTDFGIGTWLLRELSRVFAADEGPQDEQRAGSLLASGLAVNTTLAVPLVIAAVVWSAAAGPDAATAFALVSLLLYGALTAGANVLEAHLRARRRVKIVLSASITEKLVLIAGIGVVYATGTGLAAIGATYLVAGSSRIAFDAVVLFLRDAVRFVAPRPRMVLTTARSSLPFALNAGSLNLIPRFDLLALVLLSTTSAAWFAIGDRALGPALFIPAVLSATLYPFMAAPAARGASPWRLALALGIVGLLLSVFGALISPYVVPALFGSAYGDAVPVVQVMLFALPLVFATSTLLVVAYSHGREKSLLFPVVAISLVGTASIAIGQVIGGPQLAAAGYVLRQALFLVAIGAVVLSARQQAGSTTSTDVQSPEAITMRTR